VQRRDNGLSLQTPTLQGVVLHQADFAPLAMSDKAICEIQDDALVVYLVNIGHRKDVYRG